MKFIAKPGKTLPSNPIVILGVPSHGNLGQMAIDCMLSTMAQSSVVQPQGNVEQLGVLQSEWVQFITGYEEFSNAWGRTLIMPIEVYGITGTNLLLIQQRAPCISTPHAEKNFCNDLRSFLFSTAQARHVVVLCGASLLTLEDEEVLRSNRFVNVMSPNTLEQMCVDLKSFQEGMKGVDNSIQWSTVEHLREQANAPPLPVPSNELHCDDYDFSSLQNMAVGGSAGGTGALDERVEELVPGSPQVGWLLLSEGGGEGLCVLGKYCQEGNNVGDAIELAALVARMTDMPLHSSSEDHKSSAEKKRMSVPKSWASLLGPPLSLSSMSMF